MAVRVGSSAPGTFYVGGSAVNRVYQGSNLVWEPSGPPPVYDGIWFDAEGGTPGNPVTTSDAFKDAPTAITGSVTYTASGFSGTGVTVPAANTPNYLTWDKGAGAASNTHSVGFWFYLDAMPTAATRLCRIATGSTISGLVVSQNGTGVVELLTGTTPEPGTNMTFPAAGAWYWVTFWVDLLGDACALALYDAAGTQIDSNSKSGPGFPATTSYVFEVGRIANNSNFGNARFDDIRWDDTAAALIDPVMS